MISKVCMILGAGVIALIASLTDVSRQSELRVLSTIDVDRLRKTSDESWEQSDRKSDVR